MSEPADPAHITQLLHEWQSGSRDAFERLVPLVHGELCALAARRLRHEWRHDQLQVTAIVNETYLKLFDQREVDWQNRRHFFAIAARLMRRVLIDHARHQTRLKRGAPPCPSSSIPRCRRRRSRWTPWTSSTWTARSPSSRALDPDQARIIELRFFGGLTVEETAAALAVSPATVKREWAVAKGWLFRELSGDCRPIGACVSRRATG